MNTFLKYSQAAPQVELTKASIKKSLMFLPSSQ